MEKPVFKFMWNFSGPQIAKTIFEKEEQNIGLTCPDFELSKKLQ